MKLPWFARGDLDGFFGLFVDNLLQLMLILGLCTGVCGMPAELVTGRILPGAALSIFLGNAFYAWQAKRLAERTGRADVTALPYGINTVSLFAYVLFVMGPVYRDTGSPDLAWKVGLFACVGSAAIEIAGAFAGDWLRRSTPRAALLSALAGIAITFISMDFVFQIFAAPAIALLPMMVILVAYGSKVRLPLGLPGGLAAVLVGTALAWILRAMGKPLFAPDPTPYAFGLRLPVPCFGEALAFVASEQGWRYLAVILPMGLFNVIGSLQNLESAEAAGDRFETRPSLLANGLGSLAAALFGSPFPTTIYIGHPGWKAMGARWGYSVANGAVIAGLCLVGGVTLVLKVVPLEAAVGILLWIGIIIAAQAFQEVPKAHALAVAVGLVPALAAWAEVLVEKTLGVAGTTLHAAAGGFGPVLHVHGMISLYQGFILTSMILSAMLVFVIERRFLKAAGWALAAAALSWLGVIHAYDLTPGGIANRIGWGAARSFAAAYALTALLLAGMSLLRPVDAQDERTG